MTRTNAPYPDEAQAREAVSRELEWVHKNVIQKAGDARAEETSQGRGVRTIEDCQQFVVTAPGPPCEAALKKQQREFLLVCSRAFWMLSSV